MYLMLSIFSTNFKEINLFARMVVLLRMLLQYMKS